MRVVVLADTHAPRRWRACPPRVAQHLLQIDDGRLTAARIVPVTE